MALHSVDGNPHRRAASAPLYVPPQAEAPAFEVVYADGGRERRGAGPAAFTLLMKNAEQLRRLLAADLYSTALAFVREEFDVAGDLIAAIRFISTQPRARLHNLAAWVAARLSPRRLESWFQTAGQRARNIRFHYDRSNEFYQAFLDSRLVYSCAYFQHPRQSLEEAQLAKLDHLCRKLDLGSGDRFLDIGCGWGALVIHAAGAYGAAATGCTLSPRQSRFAVGRIRDSQLQEKASVLEADYLSLNGRFTKIASVGMFEHVGRHRLRRYFRRVWQLLEDDGMFLNQGIGRPEPARDGAETSFLRDRVFPGGELARLSQVTRAAGLAGFEVLDVENLRPHYGLTCRHWVDRLRRNREECLLHVDRETYRTWLLYLATSALNFESGELDLYQMLMAKRSSRARRLSRAYMYA